MIKVTFDKVTKKSVWGRLGEVEDHELVSIVVNTDDTNYAYEAAVRAGHNPNKNISFEYIDK